MEQGYYEAPSPRPEDVPSLYAEMLRSKDYGDTNFGYDGNKLRSLRDYWENELSSEYRSPRAKKEIHTLLGRLGFELLQQETKQCWDEYDSRTTA